MSEGLFAPSALPIPGVSIDRLSAALVRILPRTLLVLDLADNAEEAERLARNEAQTDGSEHWHRYFTRADLDRIHDPVFAMGMVRHEFARLVRSGASFPATTPLDGGGTGFAISSRGHVLTNYHLVTSEVANFNRAAGVLHRDDACRTLRAQVALAALAGGDGWTWRDAQSVTLVSNPPESRAIIPVAPGRGELREDVALLRIATAPAAHLALGQRMPAVGDPVWMAGFPLRTARAAAALAARGYADADGSLRVSSGVVTHVDDAGYFTTDLDGSMGNSGSPVFDRDGHVVGLFSRATGEGQRNAFEYGFVQRIHVASGLASRGLELGVELG
jgi:S1-C subfamily serine protease